MTETSHMTVTSEQLSYCKNYYENSSRLAPEIHFLVECSPYSFSDMESDGKFPCSYGILNSKFGVIFWCLEEDELTLHA